MAGTLRSALHPQRSRLILSAWLALSTCVRKIMRPTNAFSFRIAKRLRKLLAAAVFSALFNPNIVRAR